MMDAVNDPANEEIVFMKSAQVGWTEIIGNIVGYFVDQDPAPMLVMQPTLDMGESWSKDRLAPMVRDTPCLTAKIADSKSRDSGNTILHKKFAGGHVTIAGGNSPASLASRPIRVVLADEVDRYPASAGSEGDPLSLAYKRTTTFWNRRRLAGSTPTIEGVSRIARAFAQSDQRRFFVPCPACGRFQVLRWSQVKWSKGPQGEHLPETAVYECGEADEDGVPCEAAWSDAERYAAVQRGEWRATAPFAGVAGFHIWEAYSPWVRLADTVKAFLAAKGNPETLKTWTNTALGETWAERGEAPEWERVFDRRARDLKVGTVPEWAGLLVWSIDVQRAGGGRLEADLWAFGPNRRRALVEHVDLPGSIADTLKAGGDLDLLMAREWRSTDGRKMRPSRAAIDSGDGENTMAVYGWARRHPGFAMAIKGRDTLSAAQAISGPTWVDATVGGRKLRKGVRLWTVGTSMLKTELYGALQLERPADGEALPDGFVELPDGVTDEWVKQLVAEQLVRVKTRAGGVRLEWRQLRPRNEALDNAIYARAVAISLGVDRWGPAQWAKLLGEHEKPKAEAQLPPPPPPPPVASPYQNRKPPAPRRADNPFTSRRR